MVFESFVSYFLDKYLSDYIENFDSSNLKIGIWNGDVTLENLYLKSNALDELDLPIKVVFGHLKKLTLKIPWKSLYTESVKATVDGLTILVAPKSSINYDYEKERKELRDNKLNEVRRLIELERSKQESRSDTSGNEDDQQSDTFAERIQMQIIRNLELEIKNIHIRYEDNFSKPEHPFSAGITLNSVEIKTTDEKWKPTYLKENKSQVNKLATLVSFAIYCNSDDKLLNRDNKDTSIGIMQRMITNTSEINYILKPLSLSTMAILSMKPKQDNYAFPLLDFTIILETIGLNLNRLQYFDLVDMLSTIDIMALNAKYQKYKPVESLEKKTIQWWRFAYTAIVKTQIEPKRDQFKWERIRLITRTRRDYVNILKKKAKNQKLGPVDAEIEARCEDILDVFNLMLARKQADVEIARIAQQEAKTKSTWWGWISTTTSSSDSDEKSKLDEEISLSTDEKSKLYEAIGYTEESNYEDYPEEFVGLKIKFILKKFEIKLIDGEYKTIEQQTYISNTNLLHLTVENMEANLVQLPVIKGFKISSSVKSILLTGSSFDSSIEQRREKISDSKPPIMIEPELKQQDFLEFNYQLNPRDTTCSKRFTLCSKSLRFVYHATTVNNIVYFFRPTDHISSSQKKFKNAALRTISKVKQRSILYMKNNLQNIQQMELNIDIQPSYLLVPEKGNLQDFSKLLCLNFGHLSFKSEPKKHDLQEALDESFHSAEEDDEGQEINKKYKSKDQIIDLIKLEKELETSKNQVVQASYWKYEMNLEQIQILLIENSLDLDKLMNKTVDFELLDKLYILTPLDLTFKIHQCVFTDDVTLPAWKIFGNLPLVEFSLTDHKLEQIILLFLSIPFPDSKKLAPYVDMDASFDDINEKNQEIDQFPLGETKSLTSSKSKYFTTENLQQALNLEFSFEINEINFVLREKMPLYFDWISFNIKSFGTNVLQKSYDTIVNVYLFELKCEYGLFQDVNGDKLNLIKSNTETRCNLIDINLVITDIQSPTLKLLHDNVLMNIDVKLCAIDLVMNLVAFKNILDFSDAFERRLNQSKYLQFETDLEKIEKITQRENRPLLNDDQIKYLLNKKENDQVVKKKAFFDTSLIELKLKAKFDGLKTRISTRKRNYFHVDINHLELNTIGKSSQYDVHFSLNSINVDDLESGVIYSKILCPQEESQNLINIELTLYNPPKTPLTETSILAAHYQKEKFYFKNYLNENHFDLEVKARISKIKAVFLYANLDKLFGLLRILEKSSESTKQFKEIKKGDHLEQETLINQFVFLYRIKLDVNIEAPIIIVPENSASFHGLVLDCGKLTIQTRLDIKYDYFKSKRFICNQNCLNYECLIPPVVEVQMITLSKMEISRAILNKNLDTVNELFLVNCSELNVTVKRNLQPQIYLDIESISVNAIYGGLLVSIARSDYSFVLQLLLNLAEKTKEIKDIDIPEFPISHEIKPTKNSKTPEEPQYTLATNLRTVPNLSIKLFVESIQIYLHNEEYIQKDNQRDVRNKENAFSNMDLQNLQLELNMFDNTEDERDSLKATFLLDTIILDDTRSVQFGHKPIRLIEKYSPKRIHFLAPMILFNYEQKIVRPDDEDETKIHFLPEKKIDADISFLRVCVNVDYLLTLYDFFIEGIPKKIEERIEKVDFTINEEELLAVNQRLYCNVKIENPQFILYENQYEFNNSNSLIIDGLIRFNVSLQDKKTKIVTSIDDLMIRLRSFVIKRVLKRKSFVILSPTTMGLSGVIEDNNELRSAEDVDKKNQAFIFDLQDLSLNISSQMLSTCIKMLNSIQNSMNERFKTETIEEREETKVKYESLFKTIPFNFNDFWFTQLKNGKMKTSLMTSSSSSLISSQSGVSVSSSESSRVIKNQMLIRTGKIIIKLEAGLSNQLPLLCLNVSANGEFNNWSLKPSLNLNIICEMAYFNEKLSLWEPVIEPFENKPDILKPFEVSIEMITNLDIELEENPKRSRKKNVDTQLSSHLNNIRPVQTFQISSLIPLQFVITKTFLSMLDTVSKTFVLSNDLTEKNNPEQIEYDVYEQEEDNLMENFQNKLRKEVILMEDVENEENDRDEENLSFNFLIKNELGFDVNLTALDGFKFQNLDSIEPLKHKVSNIDKILLRNDSFCPINLEYDFMGSFQESMKALEEPEKQKTSMKFTLEIVNSEWQPASISLGRSNLSGYYMSKAKSAPNEINENLIICQTVNKLDKRRIYLRSSVQFINHLNIDIDLSYPVQKLGTRDYSFSDTKWNDIVIPSCGKWSLPIELISQNFTDYVKISPIQERESFEKLSINWHSSADHKLLEFDNHIFIQVLIEKVPLNILQNCLNKIDFIYNVILLPTITFHNYLPYPINYQVINDSNAVKKQRKIIKNVLKPGESAKLINAKLGSTLYLQMENYAKSSWSSSPTIEFNDSMKKNIGTVSDRIEETNIIEFRSASAKIITMYSNLVMQNHCASLMLYAPYWVLNQTKLPLDYKFQGIDDEINVIDESFTDSPCFLKINSKIFNLQNKQLLIRINQERDIAGWSNSISIDAVGNNGTVRSISKDKNGKIYEIGVDISLQKSSNGLTKILKLTPYYILINDTQFLLELKEVKNKELSLMSINIEPNSIVPFWPSNIISQSDKNCLSLRPLKDKKDLHSNISFGQMFWYNFKHSTVLTYENNPFIEALCVECVPSEEIIRIIIRPYEYGMAPVLIVNCLDNVPVVLKQNEEPDDQTFLMPYQYKLKTWANPVGKRELLWSCGSTIDQVYNINTLQSKQQFLIDNNRTGFIISFLDGLQKVLMFVDGLENLNDEIAGYKEIKGDEYVLSFNSLSLSLIDDIKKIELLYVSLTSSSIDWGEKLNKKAKVFKSFPTYKTEKIEQAYQKYLNTSSQEIQRSASGSLSIKSIGSNKSNYSYKTIAIDEQDEVDFERMVLFVGKDEIPIERQFAPSLYLNFFTSPLQSTLHLVIHKLQIDNQLYDTVFPVVFSKVLPPKSIATPNVIKPIIELSMVQSYNNRTNTTEMKFFKVLIQEFFVKIDIALLNAIQDFVTDEANDSEKKYIRDSTEFFKEINEIKKSFKDVFETVDNLNQKQIRNDKIYYDFVHISPIKMHFSFSLAGTEAFKNTNIFINNPFFKSIGLALTDMQDVVFRLGYFEVKNTACTSREFTTEVIEHYKAQVVKQAYILFLGLDVLGNPFGLIAGLAGGVESLFYEPYAGIVQGPGEFVEGMALGLKSLFSSTLGGAAGAFSKITGTLGKGLATLSMDKEFQKSRQKANDQKSTFVQNLSQNLFMGVVSGVTGIVEKPLEGAKSGGGLGFLGGLGKGIIGAVTKPTAGVIDFASQSLEGVRKVAVQEESVERVRPPRSIYNDAVIRPYKFREAQAVLIYKSLEKSIFLNDKYKASIEAAFDNKALLIATDRHIFLVESSQLFGKWKLEWHYEFAELLNEPRLIRNTIEITLKKTDSSFLFGTGQNLKRVVPIRDEAAALKFTAKVKQVLSEKDF
ncbi:unnamed protein product [Brachionus calyciflorus]|uniref:Uncharacterized protein n=1 Tax=Brachionus calyciflorus TaxID=104777 RepID=A0A813M1E3_9BILA|nr:unnamed protein product [Brachionus calyciflorus]